MPHRLAPTALLLTLGLATTSLSVSGPAAAAAAGQAGIGTVTLKVSDSAGGALSRVPLQLTSTASGSTINSRGVTNRSGVVRLDAFTDTTADLALRSGGYSSPAFGHSRIVGGSLRDTTTHSYAEVPVAVSADMERIDVVLPQLETHTLRVVTEAGQPVNEVPFSPLALVSTPITTGSQELRIMQTEGYGLLTNHRGEASITTYAMEPDADAATDYRTLSDRDEDGHLDGLAGSYYPRPGTNVDWWASYEDWATQPTTTVVVPYVPVVSGARSQPGKRTGTATVRARVMQPSAAGGAKPVKDKWTTLYRPPTATKKGLSFDRVRTNRRGYAVFRNIKLKKPTKLVVGFETTHVADTVRAVPR